MVNCKVKKIYTICSMNVLCFIKNHLNILKYKEKFRKNQFVKMLSVKTLHLYLLIMTKKRKKSTNFRPWRITPPRAMTELHVASTCSSVLRTRRTPPSAFFHQFFFLLVVCQNQQKHMQIRAKFLHFSPRVRVRT